MTDEMSEFLKGKRLTVFLTNGLTYTGDFVDAGGHLHLKDAVRIVELDGGVSDDDEVPEFELGPPDENDSYEPTSTLHDCCDHVFINLNNVLSIEVDDDHEEKEATDVEVKA